jgi:predicted metal-binding membrane protein
MLLTKIDDPRFLTVLVTSLFAIALWVATWSLMGASDMAAMDGMSGAKPMAGMETATMGEATNIDSTMAMPATDMPTMQMFGMSMDPNDWSLRTITETSVMWLLMMAAMMLPAMAPVMAVYAGISAKEDHGARLALRITLFALSYFLLWAIFSIGAAMLQLLWRGSDLFTMGGTQATPITAGVLLIIAGLYQFTPIKHACLKHCRHPLHYLLQHWKPGLAGAFPVGARHGLYCFGCCVSFMGLMFVFGAMNIWWMAVIAAYFLAEKILPKAEQLSKLTGLLLTIAGGYVLSGIL